MYVSYGMRSMCSMRSMRGDLLVCVHVNNLVTVNVAVTVCVIYCRSARHVSVHVERAQYQYLSSWCWVKGGFGASGGAPGL